MANAPDDLLRRARAFAERTQNLLGKTICDFARVVGRASADGVVVGTNMANGELSSRPIRVRSRCSTPVWLDFSCHLDFDEEGQFLSVTSSYFGVSIGPEDSAEMVFHYDYEREKARYTEAHVQVYGRHPALEAYATEAGSHDRLEKYHLPVGGRRLRPCLEDVVEFLVAENLVRPKAGWRTVLDADRREYRLTQIRAIVRRNQQTAVGELQRLGYKVLPPEDESIRARVAAFVAPAPRADNDDDVPAAEPKRRRSGKRR